MNAIRSWLLVTTTLFALPCVAQNADSCDVPIRYAAYDLDVQTVTRAANDLRYDNECGSNSSSSAGSLGVGYDGLDLKFGKSRQSSNDFCQTYQRSRENNESNYAYARVVVREALDTFLACKALEAKDVRAKFDLMPRLLTIDLKRGSASTIFRGIAVAPANTLKCVRANPQGGEDLPVVRSTPVPLSDSGESLVITCERIDKDPSDEVLFEDANVVIDTNLGSATIKLNATRYPPPTTTEQLLNSISALEQKHREQNALFGSKIFALEEFAKEWNDLGERRQGIDAVYGRRNVSLTCPPNGLMAATSLTMTSNGLWGQTGASCVDIPKFAPAPHTGAVNQASAP